MEKHNHITRDIKPLGECPSCDKYHNRNKEKPREFWIQVSIGNIALWHEKPDWFSHHVVEYSALEAERAKVDKLKDALEFYAYKANDFTTIEEDEYHFDLDAGYIAREALAELEQK